MNRKARIAGLLYLLMAVPAPFSLLYVPGKLIVPGDATATAANVLRHEMLFRTAIVLEMFTAVLFIFVALALYRLFLEVNEDNAVAMAVLAIVSIPISFVAVAGNVAALTIVRGADFLTVFNQPQRDALAMLFLRFHGQALLLTQVLWGLWLFPFGVLVMRSGFLPRLLGVLLILNAFTYPLATLTALLLPDFAGVVNRWMFPAQLGELWIMLWLVIRGVRVKAEPAVPVPA